ncbi:hypothetical protein [Rossellomorea vietnamensis]|uniref:Uncharacterized protein n=1 Tax=Rossellomorea vietnamensis TaxID=218284 RepID=A0A0N8GG88_9BACI|nr:hypothetical protein [Rossellomorea vietnamensis]KPL57818.1 hypothetical protein AM506_19905 [Rossellomorea vietnamensis]
MDNVLLSTLEVEKLKVKYGEYFEPIKSDNDFMTVLVRLKGIGVEGDNPREFFDTVKRLLEYIYRTENGKQALILTQLIHKIRIQSKFFLTDNATNVHQLCDLILIQFNHSLKDRVYYNVLKLLNYCDGSLGKFNIDSVLTPRIDNLEGNIYECFNIKLSLELLHTYLVLNIKDELLKLFSDICVDWYKFDHQVNEKIFEKLLWYAFILNRDKEIKEQITQYDSLIRSNRWGIKFFRYVTKSFSETGYINKEKLLLLINSFKKVKGYSAIEKESIIEHILKRVKEKQVMIGVERLVSYNLPPGDKLSDINQEILINLAVYENKKMTKIYKVIQVEAFSHPKREDIYMNRHFLKKLIEENEPGYIYVKEDRKANPKEEIESETEWFKWPSTDVISNPDDSNDSIGLNEKSELRKRGYQITGTTREQRWRILQRIVPDIGLKKVAYTIAGNVKLRKGQKDGSEKFRFAITEWEYDLAKLKKKYYKKDFNWPKT